MRAVYVAAPWVHKDTAARVADMCRVSGLFVTSRWMGQHADTTSNLESRKQAQADVNDLMLAENFLILNLGVSEGKACELGMALTMKKRVLLVGQRRGNIFYHLPEVEQYDTVEEAIRALHR